MGRDVLPGPGVSSRVELRLAGTFGVVRDGTELSGGELGSRKSRTLLKVLAVERPGLVGVDRIVEVLWADEPPAAPEQNVASLVSRLRGVLGPGVILGGRQGYRLAGSPVVSVDLDTAARYCEQAERKLAGSPAIALAAAERAVGLLAGDIALADEPYSACYEAERSLFLQPVVEALAPVAATLTASALQQLLGEHGPAAAALLPEVAALLGPPPSWRGSPGMERRRSFEAMTALLAGLAERAPVLLVVDDLQYAGQSTTEFIHYLSRHIPGSRLLVAVTVRAEHDQQTGAALASAASVVEVGPLGAAAVEQLAREAGQGALADSILQRTGGHTLFVVEVLGALASGDAGIPESLRSAVQARVRQVGAPVETLLRAASVLGAAIEISDEAIDVHVKYGAQLPTGHSTMHLYPIDGAASRVPSDATAFAYRDGGWAGVIVGVDPDPANADRISQWAKDYWQQLHPTSAGGAYVNFLMNEGHDRVKAAYRGNYDRLARIKQRYDPDNTFRVNQNIQPAGLGTP